MSETQHCKQFSFNYLFQTMTKKKKGIKKEHQLFWYKNKLHPIHSEKTHKTLPMHCTLHSHYRLSKHHSIIYKSSFTFDCYESWVTLYFLHVLHPKSVEPLNHLMNYYFYMKMHEPTYD